MEQTWKNEDKDWRDRTEACSAFKDGLSSIVMGQCTKAHASKVKSSVDYAAAENDGIAMLKIISIIMNDYKEYQNLAKGTFYHLRKGRNELMPNYHAHFKSHCEVMVQVGCDQVYRGVLGANAVVLRIQQMPNTQQRWNVSRPFNSPVVLVNNTRVT